MSETVDEGEPNKIRLRSPLGFITLHRYNADMWKKGTTSCDPHSEQMILESAEARALILNDGTRTYLVHSTSPDRAQQVMQDGLKFEAEYHSPEIPDLNFTALMLAGPRERAPHKRNMGYLAYRHEGEEANSAKLVFEFDVPNPGTSIQRNPFKGTFLGQADDVNIIRGTNEDGRVSYTIPSAYLKGYFDLNSGMFVSNPQFEGNS